MRLLGRLRDRFAGRHAAAGDARTTPLLSEPYRWSSLEAERQPGGPEDSASQPRMNGPTALAIHLNHPSPPSC
jgi:hypothetical protein